MSPLTRIKQALAREVSPAVRDGRVLFATLGGDVVEAVTRAQMVEIDRLAVEETGPTLLQMMENAGRSMAVLVLKRLPAERTAARVLVVAGPGGNGGGGIAAARHLRRRVGVLDVALTRPDGLSPAAASQLTTYHVGGGAVRSLDEIANTRYDLIVDAVMGYGLKGPPRGAAARAITLMEAAGAPVLSLDLPSGVDADTGMAPGPFVSAQGTLTLHLPKRGLRDETAGEICLADLGIPASVTQRAGARPADYGPAFVTPLIPL